MKAKRLTIGFLLWALAFIPTAALTIALVGVPYFLFVHMFRWTLFGIFILGLFAYPMLLFFCADALKNHPLFSKTNTPRTCFFRLFPISAITGGICFWFWSFGGMAQAAPRDFLLWLGLATAVGAGYAIFCFVEPARNAFRTQIVRLLSDPADRREIVHLVRTCERGTMREDLLNKLPYPQERETLVWAAEDGSDAALSKLPYPEERALLVQYARAGRLAALDKLPYPAEREIIVQAARDGRLSALRRLPYPEEADTLRRIARMSKDSAFREQALEKLPYPAERVTLLRAALLDEDSTCRIIAERKLPACADNAPASRFAAACADLEADPSSVISLCESIIRAYGSESPLHPLVVPAVVRLNHLYRGGRQVKKSSAHTDHRDHQDEITYADYSDHFGCGGGEDVHGDSPVHTDTTRTVYAIPAAKDK